MAARIHARVLHLLLALLFASCASGGAASSGGDPDLITEEELSTLQSSNAYEAVQRLRPRWLRSRDAREPVRLVVNGAPRGEVSELRQISVSTVSEMSYRDGQEATMRYGTGFGAGVIEVTTR